MVDKLANFDQEGKQFLYISVRISITFLFVFETVWVVFCENSTFKVFPLFQCHRASRG